MSKLNTLFKLGKGKIQENLKKFGEGDKGKGHEPEAVFQQELYFIEEKLYVLLKKQKMVKFGGREKNTYFLLQMYSTLEPPFNESDPPLNHSPLYIYQLTNLKNPQIKYFLSLKE
jgi:hypothetical protein